MIRKLDSLRSIAQISVCLLLLSLLSLSCTLPRKFWRSYEQQPFDAQKWRDGDALERGTMFVDLFRDRKIHGKTRERVLELLGEPDKKSTANGREVWHYKVEFAGEEPIQYFPVSFDKNGQAAVGTTQMSRLYSPIRLYQKSGDDWRTALSL
jgi:outer membrane protein assembly factor BamE (lipoprotein component of BamABCDE complex)